MNRRAVVTGLGAVLIVPIASEAQQTKSVARVGYLQPGEAPPVYLNTFRNSLRRLGWVERDNLIIGHRIGPASGDFASTIIAELVNLHVNVIVTWTGRAAITAQRVSDKVPIVSVIGDPVAAGLVRSLARPGGNVTGIALLLDSLEVKNLQLLKEPFPLRPASPCSGSLTTSLRSPR